MQFTVVDTVDVDVAERPKAATLLPLRRLSKIIFHPQRPLDDKQLDIHFLY